jgi:hypothetical protein
MAGNERTTWLGNHSADFCGGQIGRISRRLLIFLRLGRILQVGGSSWEAAKKKYGESHKDY